MTELITNCIGTFILKNNKITDRILFKNLIDYNNQKLVAHNEAILIKKYPDAKKQTDFIFPQAKEFLPLLQQCNLIFAKEACKSAVKKEHKVIQAVEAVKEIEKVFNQLIKKIREWYSLHCPELVENINKHETFLEIILSKERTDILRELNISKTIGADFSKIELAPLKELAISLKNLCTVKKTLEEYIEKTMLDIAPNLTAVAGSLLAAELLSHTGSLEKLAMFPSSTIQLIGAENALFRHMRAQGKSPRHGIIIKHPLLASAKNEYHGKIARMIAGAISLAAKIDYFHGNAYSGYELREKLEKRVRIIQDMAYCKNTPE